MLHVALMGRFAHPEDDAIRPRSRPEAHLAPFFVDPGKFTSDHATTTGAEAYYRAGPWLFGSEYNFAKFDTPVGGDPLFHGGDVAASDGVRGWAGSTSDNLRTDVAYGIGVLDRYGIKGTTQFFQLRIQTTL